MIEELVRDEVKRITAYQSSEKADYLINLSGNENPYPLPAKIKKNFKKTILETELNRYPEIWSTTLKQKIADHLNLTEKNILAANGSDEVLQLIMETFLKPGELVLSIKPTFAMYQYFTELVGGEYKSVRLNKDGKIDKELFLREVEKNKPKLIILCSPNNPTGGLLADDLHEFLQEIMKRFSGLVIIDEAYAEFSGETMIKYLREDSRFLITRTFSKAMGLAGIRLGYLVAASDVIKLVQKVVRPYNINKITSLLGQLVLDNYELVDARIKEIRKNRCRLYQMLIKIKGIKVYESEANYIYFSGKKILEMKKLFVDAKIKIRYYKSDLTAARITVGSADEIEAVEKVLANFYDMEC